MHRIGKVLSHIWGNSLSSFLQWLSVNIFRDQVYSRVTFKVYEVREAQKAYRLRFTSNDVMSAFDRFRVVT